MKKRIQSVCKCLVLLWEKRDAERAHAQEADADEHVNGNRDTEERNSSFGGLFSEITLIANSTSFSMPQDDVFLQEWCQSPSTSPLSTSEDKGMTPNPFSLGGEMDSLLPFKPTQLPIHDLAGISGGEYEEKQHIMDSEFGFQDQEEEIESVSLLHQLHASLLPQSSSLFTDTGDTHPSSSSSSMTPLQTHISSSSFTTTLHVDGTRSNKSLANPLPIASPSAPHWSWAHRVPSPFETSLSSSVFFAGDEEDPDNDDSFLFQDNSFAESSYTEPSETSHFQDASSHSNGDDLLFLSELAALESTRFNLSSEMFGKEEEEEEI